MLTAVHTTAYRLKHYSTLEVLLLGDLRDLLEDPFDGETRRWLVVIVDALLDMLPREFELEEEGGYMAAVLEEYPSWDAEVDGLLEQHTTLVETLQHLRGQLADWDLYEIQLQTAREGLREWSHSLKAHNRHETRLLQTAINLEVGVGD